MPFRAQLKLVDSINNVYANSEDLYYENPGKRELSHRADYKFS